MGLFGFLGRAARKVAGGIVKGVGNVVEKIGDITNNDTIRNAGWDMQSAGERLADNIGHSSAYDSSAPDIQQTIDLSKELAKYAQEIGRDSDKIEQEILGKVRQTFDELNRQADGEGLSMDINTLRREQNGCIDKVKDVLKNYIARRISLDDRECLSILEMQPGLDKEYHMKRFKDKVFLEGKQQFQNAVDSSIRNIYSVFWENFDGMMENEELSIKTTHKKLDDITQKDDSVTREYTKIGAESVILGTELAGKIIEA